MDANGVSGGGSGGISYAEHLATLTNEQLEKIQPKAGSKGEEENLQWRRYVDMFSDGFVLMSNQYEAAMNEQNPDSKEVMLSNLDRATSIGVTRGQEILLQPEAFYPMNKDYVNRMGNMVDALVRFRDQTNPAFVKKRSDDFSYMEHILAYWPGVIGWTSGERWAGFYGREIGERTEKGVETIKTGGQKIIKEAGDFFEENKYLVLGALGLIVVGVFFWKK